MADSEFIPVLGAIGRFRLNGEAPRERQWALASMWRGALAALFPEHPDFHGHDGPRTLYRYPLVQYRWDTEGPSLLTLCDSAQIAMTHPWPGTTVRLGSSTLEIVDVTWRAERFAPRRTDGLLRYTFRSPWLGLNQQNHTLFSELGARERRALLDRTVANNVLAMCRDLGWEFPESPRVIAAFEPVRQVDCHYKNVRNLGFLGSFVCNWELPEGLAIGRATSHGYGCFERA